MMLSTRVTLGIAVLTFLPWSAVLAEDTVRAIRASASPDEPSIFLVGSATSAKRLVSRSPIIQSALITALLSGAPVTIQLVENSNDEIERVEAFRIGDKSKVKFQGEYSVSRIATQRKAGTQVDHLEAFIKKASEKFEIPCNVFNPLVQQLLVAAFAAGKGQPLPLRIDVELADKTIKAVTFGEKLP